MKKFNNILLFGGETKNENMPIGFYSSLAMVPLRGKPVIWWQLDNLKTNGMDKFIVVACNNNKKLIGYIKNVLQESFDIKLVLVNSKKNILSSLKYALMQADSELPTRVILGDTLIPNSIDDMENVVYTSKEFTDSANWCLVDKDKDDNVRNYYDKLNNIDTKNKEVLVGYYAFSDTKYLQNCCIKARLMLKKEISVALEMYQEKYKIQTKYISDWYDLGHTSGLIKAKNILFNARDFNSITVDTNMGLLTKSSTKTQKLEDEAFWYTQLPEDLKILAPRLISFKKDNKSASLVQELYGYPSLQELYLSGEVNLEDWQYILEKLFSLHKVLENHTTPRNEKAFLWLYLHKTQERIAELKKQNSYWETIINKEVEYINGEQYNGLSKLMDGIEQFATKLSKSGIETIVHGDYCFSNILFDSSNYVFKLIDPRGRLNAEPTIFGDPRYDIAKLRHSVVGLYDFIVHGLFEVSENKNEFEYKILTTKNYSVLEEIFDKYTVANGFNPNEIKFIEGLLFLSMIPLHKDNFERQKMFYIRALELLNDTVSVHSTRITENKDSANLSFAGKEE